MTDQLCHLLPSTTRSHSSIDTLSAQLDELRWSVYVVRPTTLGMGHQLDISILAVVYRPVLYDQNADIRNGEYSDAGV
jgi:hypothetical protein